MGELNFCLIPDIIKTAAIQMALDQPNDLGLPMVFIRTFHNKIFYAIFFSLRCYFLYLDSFQIGAYTNLIFLPFAIYGLVSQGLRKILWILVAAFPILMMTNPLKLNLGGRIDLFSKYYLFLGIIGIIKMIWQLYKRLVTRV